MKSTGKSESERAQRVRGFITRGFGHFEDAVYVGLALLLACSAAALLVTGAKALWTNVLGGAPLDGMIDLLDRSLFILMIVEVLYTVQVSFRSHSLVPEPFLVVGLIATTRRILIVTAQFSRLAEKHEEAQLRTSLIEVALLTVMVVALVGSLRMLRGTASTGRERENKGSPQ